MTTPIVSEQQRPGNGGAPPDPQGGDGLCTDRVPGCSRRTSYTLCEGCQRRYAAWRAEEAERRARQAEDDAPIDDPPERPDLWRRLCLEHPALSRFDAMPWGGPPEPLDIAQVAQLVATLLDPQAGPPLAAALVLVLWPALAACVAAEAPGALDLPAGEREILRFLRGLEARPEAVRALDRILYRARRKGA
jgi:hypothetical protein